MVKITKEMCKKLNEIGIPTRWSEEIILGRSDIGPEIIGSCEVDLRKSNLGRSDLRESNLRGSDLRDSDLRDSDLSGSDLRGSDLSGSNLRVIDLSGSDLRGSKIDAIVNKGDCRIVNVDEKTDKIICKPE